MTGHFPATSHPFPAQLALASAAATTIFSKRIASRSCNRVPNRVPMSQIRKICVYCGSGPGSDPDFVTVSRKFGKTMADHGIGLIYGGGAVGLSGAIDNTVLVNGWQ